MWRLSDITADHNQIIYAVGSSADLSSISQYLCGSFFKTYYVTLQYTRDELIFNLYKNGNIINNQPIIDTTQTMSGYANDGSGAVTNTNGFLQFNAFPTSNAQWRNSYIRTGITVESGDTLEFTVKDNLHNYADTITTITANSTGEILLCFDDYRWDGSDTRNVGNFCSVLIWDGIGTPNTICNNNTPNLPVISGHIDYGQGQTRPIVNISEIILEIS